jgi:hypothetical protein
MSLSEICSDLCNAVKTGKSEPQAVERFLNSIDHKDDPKGIIDCLRKLGQSYLSVSEGDSTEAKAKALGDGILRRFLRRVSLTKPTSAPVRF